MKKIFLLILALSVLIVPSLILADNSASISYLKSQTQNAWVSQALAVVNEDNVDIGYLNYQTDNLMEAAKNILVLASLESNDVANINTLKSVLENNKSGGQFGSADLVNDDFWAVMALGAINDLDDHQDVKNYILNNQNSDGGWSWSAGGDSDSNDTAAALMALYEFGLRNSDSVVVSGLNYLQSTQNNDGGFGYDTDSDSDGASTSWVISTLNKYGIDVSSWQKNNNNPLDFLDSLRQEDGSYLWMASDSQGSAMVTAYALLALSGSSYPVNSISIEDEVIGHSLRIEGPDNTICLANNLEADNVLELLEVGTEVCDYDYFSQDSAYGVYISSIAGIEAEGMDGWQYFVDYQSGMVPVTDYVLEGNQEVLWAYGGWPLYPVKIEVNANNFEAGQELQATFQYYNETWLPLANQTIVFGSSEYQTNNQGQFSTSLDTEGVFSLYSKQASEYIRSAKEYIVVGDGVSQTVDLLVNIEDDGGSSGGEDTIAFSVDRSNIDFGILNPGQATDTLISLSNTGNVDVYIEASVLGDSVFTDFTSLDESSWENYNLNLPKSANQGVNVGLSIPDSFNDSGSKQGQLIFWAVNQN